MNDAGTSDAVYWRKQRGLRIVEGQGLLQKSESSWRVSSQSHAGAYIVDLDDLSCTCPDRASSGLFCKHIYAVLFAQLEARTGLPTEKSAAPLRPTYPQKWKAYNAAQQNEKAHFEVLLADLCRGIVQPTQRTGRNRLPLADVVYAAVMKVYSTFSGRRASTDILECESKGFINHSPHYNSVFNYLRDPTLTPLLTQLIEQSARPLRAVETQFAVDSTGFSTSVYNRWLDHKYGKPKKKAVWLKAHASIGVKTHIVTSVTITDGDSHDSPEFAGLVRRTAQAFPVKGVMADKAYLSHDNLEVVAAVGGAAYVPFKSNSTDGGSKEWEKLWHLFHYRQDEFKKHYHLRSNCEAGFSMIKRKIGGSVKSKKFESQTNEILCKFLAHNIIVLIHEMYELGITPEFHKN